MTSFSPTRRQVLANETLSNCRHVLLYGGSRSGKTFAIVRKIVYRAVMAPGSRHAIFRFRFNHVRASVWLDTLPKVLDICFPPEVQKEDRRQDGFTLINTPAGTSEIWFGGLDEKDRVEKILGNEFSTLFFNECSQIPYSSVTTALTRLAQSTSLRRQQAYYDCNPPSTAHWLHRIFIEKRDPISKKSLPNPGDYTALGLNPRDNSANLSPEYIASLAHLPERQRRRFLLGEFTSDTEGALWTLDILDQCRAEADDLPALTRVAIGVDPSGASGEEDKRSDEIGIVAAGVGSDGHGYVLGDYSLRANPDAWARTVINAYDKHEADIVVAERNYGGDMVRHTIQTARPDINVRLVTASRGKHVRAEPVSALYEQGKVHHVGRFEDLEDQLLGFTVAGYMGDRSPDRADAAVWVLTALMLGMPPDPAIVAPVQVGGGPAGFSFPMPG